MDLLSRHIYVQPNDSIFLVLYLFSIFDIFLMSLFWTFLNTFFPVITYPRVSPNYWCFWNSIFHLVLQCQPLVRIHLDFLNSISTELVGHNTNRKILISHLLIEIYRSLLLLNVNLPLRKETGQQQH